MGARFPTTCCRLGRRALKEGAAHRLDVAPGHATDDIRLGFVYERVQHVTLKSIANNPDIRRV